jgi:hypothetical protein
VVAASWCHWGLMNLVIGLPCSRFRVDGLLRVILLHICVHARHRPLHVENQVTNYCLPFAQQASAVAADGRTRRTSATVNPVALPVSC